jgi:glycerol uptake facilitator-like aquaporin
MLIRAWCMTGVFMVAAVLPGAAASQTLSASPGVGVDPGRWEQAAATDLAHAQWTVELPAADPGGRVMIVVTGAALGGIAGVAIAELLGRELDVHLGPDYIVGAAGGAVLGALVAYLITGVAPAETDDTVQIRPASGRSQFEPSGVIITPPR